MNPTFHERQYELAMNVELVAQSSQYFAPAQLVEEKVGYDVALVPGHVAIWSYLGVTKAPTGKARRRAVIPQVVSSTP